jgi:hypothetical protein
MLFDNFIITNERFLQPSYRISPFKTEHISKNNNLVISNNVDLYFNFRFGERKYIYTRSGRDAINKALCNLDLIRDDVVTIFTTSNNFYISGCVTKEIEKHCKWSRQIEKNTKVVFVNHEFGFPYENLMDLKKYGLPIIEDCAHSFLSQNKEKNVGLVGDYVVYSLPKFFPLQFGGILRTNTKAGLMQDISKDEEIYIKKVLSSYIESLNEIKNKRVHNYEYLEKRLSQLGFEPRFKLEEHHCPGVYLFKTKNVDLNKLKVFLQEHGVECSVFYGEEAFFVPVNQNLDTQDMEYFYSLIKYYLSKVEDK